MEIREDYFYTPEHEWARITGDDAVFGLTAYAIDQLGGITFIDPPASGDEVTQSDPFAEVESVKAVSDIYAPLSGEVIEVNDALSANPELIDQDPYEEGWICRVSLSNTDELNELMSAEEYEEFLDELNE